MVVSFLSYNFSSFKSPVFSTQAQVSSPSYLFFTEHTLLPLCPCLSLNVSPQIEYGCLVEISLS